MLQVLSIFGHTGQEASDVMYCSWLHMARLGVLALRTYCPETGAWKNVHSQAHFALLVTMLVATDLDASAGEPFFRVRRTNFEMKNSEDV